MCYIEATKYYCVWIGMYQGSALKLFLFTIALGLVIVVNTVENNNMTVELKKISII